MAITFNPLTRSLDNTVEGQTNLGTNTNFGDNVKLTFGAANDLEIYHDGSFNYILSPNAHTLIQEGNEIQLRAVNNEKYFKGVANGASELYYDGVKTLETTSVGATLTGNFSMTAELNLLGGSDGARFIDSQVGDGNALHLRRITGGDAGHENMAKFHGGGSCELYHDNVKKIETTSSGVTVTGSVTTQDMNMSNLNGSANEVDNTKGSWSLQEGANDLFLINRVNGKKYKFNLTEIN